MRGDEKIRFCGHCSKNVNNISEMTRKEALRLVRESNGSLCVRYVKNPSNSKPVFADRLYRISRRAGIAAGVLGASLSLSTVTFAQGNVGSIKRELVTGAQTETPKEKRANEEKAASGTSRISGTITDPNGAVIPGVSVTLSAEGFEQTISTSEEGFYQFDNLKAGIYSIKVAAVAGLEEALAAQDLAENSDTVVNLTLKANSDLVTVTVGEVALAEFKSLVHKAVADDDVDQLKNLIADGRNINEKDENYDGVTPLFLAVENGNVETAEILLAYGAKVNVRDAGRQTALMRLDDDASPELVRALIKYGAKISPVDREGNTALILAARSVKAEVLQILLDHGADVNARNKQGQTALMNAADADNLESVRALIMAGADVNLKNKEGETAWDLATSAEIADLLESHGATFDEEN